MSSEGPVDDVLRDLQVDPAVGLSEAEAARRLARDGPNELQHIAKRSPWSILWAQFANVVMALLVAAGAISAALGEFVEASAIAILIAINVALGFFMEWRASREMEALRSLSQVETVVRRDGTLQQVRAEDLVVGDILILEGGDIVTADARILEASALSVDESTFTGESTPVHKAPGNPGAVPIHERTHMLHKGTAIRQGAAEAVVIATGTSTELGHIADLVSTASAEATPLERRLAALGRTLIVVALALAALTAVAGLLRGHPPALMLKTSVALAVAAVPEGLPVVATLALARGMLRMARHNAIIRRLAAVETLGSATVICTDKTGTLTENRMTVTQTWIAADEPRFHEALVLCNNASLDPDVGDPMEVALLHAAAEHLDLGATRDANPRARQWAFDPAIRMMATAHGDTVYVKGAPEALLARCPNPDAEAQNEALAETGLRVLGIAKGSPGEDPYHDLTWLGLVGLLDPARPEVPDAIRQCQEAGVTVVMVTGDQHGTAARVARDVGIATEPALDGSKDHAPEALRDARLLTRVTPEQKLNIVAAHQAAGHVVAMTGDGVNDAPALRKADIGIAMGTRGTQVAREASDVVLRDDSFATIVTAIHMGRTIFTNIRRFAFYLLSCNVGEIAVIAIATMAGSSLPLLPLQILFLNFVTDVFPALALGFGRGDKTSLKRPPRDPSEQILTRQHGWGIGAYGLVFAGAVLTAFAVARGPLALDTTGALTVSFATLALAQLWHVFNVRERGTRFLRNDIVTNGYVWGALAVSVVMIIVAIHVPALAEILSLRPLGLEAWLLVVGMSLVPLVIGQAWLATGRRTT